MKNSLKILAVTLLSLILFLPSVLAIFYYTEPMEDVTYELFTLGGDGEEWQGANGWSFYKNEAGQVTELTSDGYGGYTGLTYPGQTFYYSRQLTETLDSPTIKIGVANRTISVFLDDNLIYTDCPELDNRIGYLELPMLEYDKAEPVTFSLPADYMGKTLTIAQSSPPVSELQIDSPTVWPCEVTLYCGYAYESSLIASTVKTMLPAVLLFALQIFLLAVFIRYAYTGTFLWQLPVFVLSAFFQMCSILLKAEFFFQYFGAPDIDYISLCFYFSIAALLLLFCFYTKKLRLFYLLLSAVQWSSGIFSLLVQAGFVFEYGDFYLFFQSFPQITGIFTLLAALIGAFFLWKQGNTLFKHLAQGVLLLLTVYGLFLVISVPFAPEYTTSVITRIRQEIAIMLPNISLRILWLITLLPTLWAVLMDIVEQESQRRSEHEVLAIKNELAMESYENLQMQSEEIRMLRHDTMKHYHLLHTMAKEMPEKIPGYLDELIGQVEHVRPVVASQNQILNIIFNGKLNAAAAKGISTEVIRYEAPKKLPLTEVELCCLMVNILDNAISAAARSDKPYIKLDFHCKNKHFVFSCENSISTNDTKKKNPRKNRGYGLKIIEQIMHRFGDNMYSVEQTKNSYKVTIILPL